MKYIYDILVNLHSKYYDFFDWNSYDELLHLKKIPIIKVDSKKLNSIKYDSCIFDKSFLNKIYKKSEFFKLNLVDLYNYIFIVCDSREALVVNLDQNGNIISRSSMILDEENEVLDICECMNLYDFDLVSLNKNNKFEFMTRFESERFKFIKSELKIISDEKIRFLYYECFNEIEDDKDKIYSRFMKEMNNNFNLFSSKIYDFLKLFSFNK